MPNSAKTNAIRRLEAAHANFETRFFDSPRALSGIEVAHLLNRDQDRVFKTLVTQGKSGNFYVFMIPVACELDLKKAACAVKEKSIAMIRSRDLLSLTGYIHGGCSPIGMKKQFPTTIDETAKLFESIMFSGGRIGCQIEMSLDELMRIIPIQIADLVVI